MMCWSLAARIDSYTFKKIKKTKKFGNSASSCISLAIHTTTGTTAIYCMVQETSLEAQVLCITVRSPIDEFSVVYQNE